MEGLRMAPNTASEHPGVVRLTSERAFPAPSVFGAFSTRLEKPIRVLLAEDHTIVRQGLRSLLETEPAVEVVGEAETGRHALSLALSLRPDVILMDIAMPSLNGLEATRQIVRDLPEIKVVILSSYTDEVYVSKLLAAGASGFLSKQTAVHHLLHAIKEAQKGNPVFSPDIAKRMEEKSRKNFTAGAPSNKPSAQLTSREFEVLQLIAEGYANKQIASELSISIKTVEKHRQRVMDKLDIHQTAGLTRYAIEKGVVESRTALQLPG